MSTEGMEILRLVAAIPLWRDRYHDAEKDVVSAETLVSVGVTARHVRAARAIVAAAERKEVMPHAAGTLEVNSWGTEARSSDVTTPPTAGPIPAEGALQRIKDRIDTRLNNCLCEMKPDYDDSIVGFNEAWDIVRAVFAQELAAPSPQPPAPAEGAPDVEGLAAKLKRYANNVHSVGAQYTLTSDDAAKAADALTAQAAEIERLRGWIDELRLKLVEMSAALEQTKDQFSRDI